MPRNSLYPSDQFDHGNYDASTFDASTVDDICTEDDIIQAFHALQESELWIPNINCRRNSFDFCIFVGIIAFVGLLMFFIGTSTLAIETEDLLFYPFLMIIFVLLGFFGNNILKKTTGAAYLHQRQIDFNERLRKLNKSDFLSKGFRFEAGEMGAWIELQFMKPSEKLGNHHRNIEKQVEKEINEELVNDLYLNGVTPCEGKSWQDF